MACIWVMWKGNEQSYFSAKGNVITTTL